MTKPNNSNKVAVLRVPLEQWNHMSAQQQMLYIMQQTIGFMASDFYGDMDGMRIVAHDPNNIAANKVVFTVGAEPLTVLAH